MKKVGRVTAPPCEACREGKPCLKCSHWQALVFLPSFSWIRLHWPSCWAASEPHPMSTKRRKECLDAGQATRTAARGRGSAPAPFIYFDIVPNFGFNIGVANLT